MHFAQSRERGGRELAFLQQMQNNWKYTNKTARTSRAVSLFKNIEI